MTEITLLGRMVTDRESAKRIAKVAKDLGLASVVVDEHTWSRLFLFKEEGTFYSRRGLIGIPSIDGIYFYWGRQ